MTNRLMAAALTAVMLLITFVAGTAQADAPNYDAVKDSDQPAQGRGAGEVELE